MTTFTRKDLPFQVKETPDSATVDFAVETNGTIVVTTPATATDAANFSATKRIAVKGADGVTYYIAASTTAW